MTAQPPPLSTGPAEHEQFILNRARAQHERFILSGARSQCRWWRQLFRYDHPPNALWSTVLQHSVQSCPLFVTERGREKTSKKRLTPVLDGLKIPDPLSDSIARCDQSLRELIHDFTHPPYWFPVATDRIVGPSLKWIGTFRIKKKKKEKKREKKRGTYSARNSSSTRAQCAVLF